MKSFLHDTAPRLTALRARHRSLETRIEMEQRRPLPDAALVRELKRSKLAVKEEIVALERMRPPSAA